LKKSAIITVVLLTLLVTPSAFAVTRSCTAGMVTLNICRSTSDVAYCLAIGTSDPDGIGPLLAPSQLLQDAFAVVGNYQTPAACTSEMVTGGVCSSGQIGTLVAITKAQFADIAVRRYVMETIRRYRAKLVLDAAQVATDTESAPDIGN